MILLVLIQSLSLSLCDIKSHLDLINSFDITGQEKENVFWKNASRLFELNISSVPTDTSTH